MSSTILPPPRKRKAAKKRAPAKSRKRKVSSAADTVITTGWLRDVATLYGQLQGMEATPLCYYDPAAIQRRICYLMEMCLWLPADHPVRIRRYPVISEALLSHAAKWPAHDVGPS
jgi:hypothetical protein